MCSLLKLNPNFGEYQIWGKYERIKWFFFCPILCLAGKAKVDIWHLPLVFKFLWFVPLSVTELTRIYFSFIFTRWKNNCKAAGLFWFKQWGFAWPPLCSPQFGGGSVSPWLCEGPGASSEHPLSSAVVKVVVKAPLSRHHHGNGRMDPRAPIPLPGNPPLSLDPSEERRLFDLWVQAKSGEALLAPCWPGNGPSGAARWTSCVRLSGWLSHLAGSYARLLRIKTAGIVCR